MRHLPEQGKNLLVLPPCLLSALLLVVPAYLKLCFFEMVTIDNTAIILEYIHLDSCATILLEGFFSNQPPRSSKAVVETITTGMVVWKVPPIGNMELLELTTTSAVAPMDIADFTFVSKEHPPLFTTAMKGLVSIVAVDSSHNKSLSVKNKTLPDTSKGK